jgi:hypothetical protein
MSTAEGAWPVTRLATGPLETVPAARRVRAVDGHPQAMGLEAYTQLTYMALATWTTHMVVAQNVIEAVTHFYARSAAPSEPGVRDPAARGRRRR